MSRSRHTRPSQLRTAQPQPQPEPSMRGKSRRSQRAQVTRGGELSGPPPPPARKASLSPGCTPRAPRWARLQQGSGNHGAPWNGPGGRRAPWRRGSPHPLPAAGGLAPSPASPGQRPSERRLWGLRLPASLLPDTPPSPPQAGLARATRRRAAAPRRPSAAPSPASRGWRAGARREWGRPGGGGADRSTVRPPLPPPPPRPRRACSRNAMESRRSERAQRGARHNGARRARGRPLPLQPARRRRAARGRPPPGPALTWDESCYFAERGPRRVRAPRAGGGRAGRSGGRARRAWPGRPRRLAGGGGRAGAVYFPLSLCVSVRCALA